MYVLAVAGRATLHRACVCVFIDLKREREKVNVKERCTQVRGSGVVRASS